MRLTQPFTRTDSSYRRMLDSGAVVILCHNAHVMRVHYHRYEQGVAKW
jgi:poly-gamma-glutamate capsule biosynthesis protein CapA/YwtB (metallophosphatase superfamily)